MHKPLKQQNVETLRHKMKRYSLSEADKLRQRLLAARRLTAEEVEEVVQKYLIGGEIDIPIKIKKLTQSNMEVSSWKQKQREERAEDLRMYLGGGVLLGLLVAFAFFGLLD